MTKTLKNITKKRSKKSTLDIIKEQQQAITNTHEEMENLLMSTLEYYKEKAIQKNTFDQNFYNEIRNHMFFIELSKIKD